MNWKEFLKPTKSKIFTTLILAFVGSVLSSSIWPFLLPFYISEYEEWTILNLAKIIGGILAWFVLCWFIGWSYDAFKTAKKKTYLIPGIIALVIWFSLSLYYFVGSCWDCFLPTYLRPYVLAIDSGVCWCARTSVVLSIADNTTCLNNSINVFVANEGTVVARDVKVDIVYPNETQQVAACSISSINAGGESSVICPLSISGTAKGLYYFTAYSKSVSASGSVHCGS